MKKLAGPLLFVAGLTAAYAGVRAFSNNPPPVVASTADPRPGTGKEIVLIYITDPLCAACREEWLDGMVLDAKETLRVTSKSMGYEFATLGIVIAAVNKQARAEAERFGSLDELMIGRWGNTAAMKYIWEALPGRALTPQAIVVEREYVGPPDSLYAIHNERVIARLYGLAELQRWQTARFPIGTMQEAR